MEGKRGEERNREKGREGREGMEEEERSQRINTSEVLVNKHRAITSIKNLTEDS